MQLQYVQEGFGISVLLVDSLSVLGACFSCLAISWVSSNSITNYLLAWEGYFGRKVKKKKALAFFLCDLLEDFGRTKPKSL